MNRQQIRNKILQQSEYAPDDSVATGYINYVNSAIQDAYMEIWNRRAYEFNEKQLEIPIFTELNYNTIETTAGGRHSSLGVTDRSTTATFTAQGSKPAIFVEGNHIDPLMSKANPYHIGMYPLILQDGNNRNYALGKSHDGKVFTLGQDWRGTSAEATTTTTNWTVAKQDYVLPQDLIEIMDITFRDSTITNASRQGKTYSVPPRMDVDANLRLNQTAAKPNYYVPLNFGNTEPLEWLQGVTIGSGGSLVATKEYAVGVSTYDFETGIESAILVAASGLTGNTKITYQWQPATEINAEEWANKAPIIYLGIKESDGAYVFYPSFDNGSQSDKFWTLVDAAGNPVRHDLPLRKPAGSVARDITTEQLFRPRYAHHGGTQKVIRFYPRPTGGDKTYTSTDYENEDNRNLNYFTLRYIYKPQELRKDSDVPAIPENFHMIIVELVLQQIYMRFANPTLAELHKKKYETLLRRLDSRYATNMDSVVQRGQSQRFGSIFSRARFPRYTVTYTS
tara:strand:- start:14662 stop:16185 length:1524 start_codon:yes stop_codon:yes gene_type:complete